MLRGGTYIQDVPLFLYKPPKIKGLCDYVSYVSGRRYRLCQIYTKI